MAEAGGGEVRPGDVLAGKYRVERVLGSGAMGVVLAAMHIDLHEMRAIKRMLPSARSAADQEERFLREARAAARLRSQHATRVYDVGRLESGAPYIVMEFLEGADLKTYLDSRGPLPVAEAVTHVLQACEALGEAHAAGIVHRDLKPANMFLTRGVDGSPCIKVLDFGIAKMASPAGTDAIDVTKTSDLLGTPLYMSPEQMRSTRAVDARTDVWALGAILYRMLTGKTPFTGTTVTEICSAVIADLPDPPAALRPDLPRELEAIVLRCLEKKAADRFANARELGAALSAFARDSASAQPVSAPPASSSESEGVPSSTLPAPGAAVRTLVMEAPRPPAPPAGQTTTRGATWTEHASPAPRRSRAVLWIAAGGVALAAVVGGGFWMRRRTDSHAGTPAATVNEAVVKTATAPAAPTPTPTNTASPAPREQPSSTAAATAEPVLGAPAKEPRRAVPAVVPGPSRSAPVNAARPSAPAAKDSAPAPAAPPPTKKDAFGDEQY